MSFYPQNLRETRPYVAAAAAGASVPAIVIGARRVDHLEDILSEVAHGKEQPKMLGIQQSEVAEMDTKQEIKAEDQPVGSGVVTFDAEPALSPEIQQMADSVANYEAAQKFIPRRKNKLLELLGYYPSPFDKELNYLA